MPRYVAFLRAINVGGRTVTMRTLRDLFAGLGFTGVETFIASGNVIFHSPSPAPLQESRIEATLESALGYPVDTFLRSLADVAGVAALRPFPDDDMVRAHAVMAGFFRQPLTPMARKAVLALRGAEDDFAFAGREIYWLRRAPFAGAKVTPAHIEKAAGASGTFRNLSTIRKIAAKYPPG